MAKGRALHTCVRDSDARGSLRDPKPVIAIERGHTYWYRSRVECTREYGIRNARVLGEYLKSGQVGPDGYTTFDDPEDGVIYDGMQYEDIEQFVFKHISKPEIEEIRERHEREKERHKYCDSSLG